MEYLVYPWNRPLPEELREAWSVARALHGPQAEAALTVDESGQNGTLDASARRALASVTGRSEEEVASLLMVDGVTTSFGAAAYKGRMAFVSRHSPTWAQVVLAAEKGYELVPVGDSDGFNIDPSEFRGYAAVVVVHAAAAAALVIAGVPVAVFRNGNRAPEGAPPQFEAVDLAIYRFEAYVAAARRAAKAAKRAASPVP